MPAIRRMIGSTEAAWRRVGVKLCRHNGIRAKRKFFARRACQINTRTGSLMIHLPSMDD
jgi:hypothetical protein